MTRDDLARDLARRADLSAVQADRLLRLALDSISQFLADGERLELRGFGSFWVQQWPERVVADPVTRQPKTVPGRRAARFRPGETLRRRLNPKPEGSDHVR